MNCPRCDSESKVEDSRKTSSVRVRRRRKCLVCNYKFTTYEVLAGEIQEIQEVEMQFRKMIKSFRKWADDYY